MITKSITRLAIVLIASTLIMFDAAAVEIGEDGLHKQEWFALTFKDVVENLRDAATQGKRLVLVFEQPGCAYCAKTHATVLSDAEVVKYIQDHYVVVQYNLWGDEEVKDLDGEILSEKSAAEKWGVMFTPSWVFLPDTIITGRSVSDIAVGQMPGAFGKGTFLDLFTWMYEKGYEGDESFQRYHNRRDAERRAAADNG